jgi:hypothetical protein
MQIIKTTLGGQSYTISELPARKNAEWRKRLTESFGSLANILTLAPGIELDNPAQLPRLMELLTAAVGNLAGSVDVVAGLLFDYSPELDRDRERILDDSYDSEIITAFAGVLTLAYPFGAVMGLARDLGRKVGSARPGT